MSPIEDYLDQLLVELRGSARDVRRILAEVEEHLFAATAEGVAEGLPEEKAQWRAIDRFGPPRMVASRFGRPAAWPALRALARSAPLFAAVGLIAIGVSGAISEALGRLFGPAFVAGDPPDVRYTAARCADFQEYFPGKSCLDAAAWHHWGEVVEYRVAAGVLGLLLLGGALLYRRRRRKVATAMTEVALPPGLLAGAATALYGLAAAALLLQGASEAVAGGTTGGTGQWLSAGGVALVGAIAYGLVLLRSLAAGPAQAHQAHQAHRQVQ
jgi:HAAS